jgi:hypothetical protein
VKDLQRVDAPTSGAGSKVEMLKERILRVYAPV